MPSQKTFSEAKADFDAAHRTAATASCFVPVNGKHRDSAPIRDTHGKPSEEYYKWQFMHALVNSGLYARDFIGAEVQFPKGNSAVLRLDGAIFDSGDWLDHYNGYWKDRHATDLEWLNDHLLAVIEFKKNDKEIEKVFTSQVKPAMREKEPASAYVLGIYYGADRLYLFQRKEGKYLRYDEGKNQKGDASKVGDLSLHLPDAYGYLPDFEELQKHVNRPASLDRSKRTINDLDVITTAGWKLDDANVYGVDLDKNMLSLAALNMLLNGDGEAKLFSRPDNGSILSKIATGGPPTLVDLIPSEHVRGKWDDWPDKTELMKFDVVLTNPPFGEDRAYRVKTDADRRIIEMYETWHLTRQKVEDEDAFGAKHERGKSKKAAKKGSDALDKGVIFLENAYRSLKDNGRFGIILSNSIASINKWTRVRDWLMDNMRIVALFDLPANVFAETGVNTSIVIAYKPKPAALKRLNAEGYSIFVRDIVRVGYEKRTSKRNVFFNPTYQIDETTFEIQVDAEGRPVLDEEFTETLSEFRQWALAQEKTLQDLFLKES